MADSLSFIPLSGIGDVTKNMYLYEYKGSILIVDCGLGFPDETMIGVDLLIPDVSYLVERKEDIVGMVLTHGHEDHFGALPYVVPELPSFPIFATRLTAAFANEKLKEFGVLSHRVKAVPFADTVSLGPFSVSFVRMTHSVPDTANLIIATAAGTLYHASDFKFDETPSDNLPSEVGKIKEAGRRGVLALFCDCLRAEKEGRTPSERFIEQNFEREIRDCRGKFIVTTYSSNVSRLNQAIRVARKHGRKVCFLGRSLEKARDVAIRIGYMENLSDIEVPLDAIRNYKDSQLLLMVAGSQGQENSAMARIAADEEDRVSIREDDVIAFSADPIPGNEVAINSLIDTLSKKGARVIYSALTDDLHVSGHGAREDISDMIRLTNPKFLIPIGGAYRHMVQFRNLAQALGHEKRNVFLLENGQEVVFKDGKARLGRKVHVKTVYVDQTGEEVESFVLRDLKKLSEGGIAIILLEVDGATGHMVGTFDIIARGFIMRGKKLIAKKIAKDLHKALGRKRGRVTNWGHIRKLVGDITERIIQRELRLRPLVFPVVIEV